MKKLTLIDTNTDSSVTAFLGETDEENWKLIDNSEEDYIWMHLNSFPSGHLVINCINPTSNILFEGGQICKQNTKYKNLPNLKICYTPITNLLKGETKGSVQFKSNRRVKTIKLSR